MALSAPDRKVDSVLGRPQPWIEEMRVLRQMARETGLTEELKWGWPCYSLQGQNIVLIHAFKEYCALLFFKGSLMADPETILIQQTENVIGRRQIRFTSMDQIRAMAATIRAYIDEAVRVEQSGAKVQFRETREFPVPPEFQQALEGDAAWQDKVMELMAACDASIPEPQRELDKPFLMPIEDVFTITGRGTVVTGKVEQGRVHTGDEIEIVGLRDTQKTTCTGVEMFRKLLDEGQAGDNIGALLRGTKKEDVERGQVLCAPG